MDSSDETSNEDCFHGHGAESSSEEDFEAACNLPVDPVQLKKESLFIDRLMKKSERDLVCEVSESPPARDNLRRKMYNPFMDEVRGAPLWRTIGGPDVDLSPDCWTHVWSFLDPEGLLACMLCCGAWYRMLDGAEHAYVWSKLDRGDRAKYFANVACHSSGLGLVNLGRKLDLYSNREAVYRSKCQWHHLRTSRTVASGAERAVTELEETLKLENAHRRVGVTGGLFSVRDIRRCSGSYNPPHGLTVLRMYDFHETEEWGMQKDFERRFLIMAPVFVGFDLPANGLVVAGGAASALAVGHAMFDDIDLFLVHSSEDSAWRAIQNLASHLYAVAQAGPAVGTSAHRNLVDPTPTGRTMLCSRTTSTISFKIDGLPNIQVVLRLYGTVSEVVHGFDLGSSAFAYDGSDVYTSHLGLYTLKYRTNVLDLSVLRPTYGSRIVKYMSRGWSLVLPDFSYRKYSRAFPGESLPRFLEKGDVIEHRDTSCPCRLWLKLATKVRPLRRERVDYDDWVDWVGNSNVDGNSNGTKNSDDDETRMIWGAWHEKAWDDSYPVTNAENTGHVWYKTDPNSRTILKAVHEPPPELYYSNCHYPDEDPVQTKTHAKSVAEWKTSRTLLDNMKELIKFRTGGCPIDGAVKAEEVYTPGLDIKAMGPKFVSVEIENAILARLSFEPAQAFLAQCTGLSVGELAALKTALDYVHSIDSYVVSLLSEETPFDPDPHEQIRKLANSLAQELTALNYVVPFRFMKVEENTRLTGPLTVGEKELKEWYGAAYR
jgi:hypothetical protein